MKTPVTSIDKALEVVSKNGLMLEKIPQEFQLKRCDWRLFSRTVTRCCSSQMTSKP